MKLTSLPNALVAFTLMGHFAMAGPVTPNQGGKGKVPLDEPLQEFHPMYLGSFNTGVKTSDVYTEGNVSFVIPLWSTLGADGTLGGDYLFLEPYVSLGEQGELASSLGLGWRHYFNTQPVSALGSNERAGFLTEGFYVGANVFVDNLRTQFDNDFWQLGIGAEIGSRYLELRGNYYLPFDSSPKLAERSTDRQTFTDRSSNSSTRMEQSGTPLSDPFASGNSIQQEAYVTNTAVTTTRTTTTRTTVTTITSLFEEGMEGWDIEGAFLIPGLDQYLDVSIIGGYYSFDNQPFGPQRGGSGKTEGWKAGIEIRPVPALVLTGMWYEDEGLTGSDWVAGVGLQIPLGREWKDAFKPRRRHLIERMAEPVARQNAAIKTARSYEQEHDVEQTSSTKTAVSRRVVSEGPQRIVIKDDIIFVNNGGAVGNGIEAGSQAGDGTAENPVNTVQLGASFAGANSTSTGRVWNVYTQGGGAAYGEGVLITGSTNFIISYTPIVSAITGGVFGGDTLRPEVSLGFGALNIPYVGIEGYNITGGFFGSAAMMNNVNHAVIRDNIISGNTVAVYMLQDTGSGLVEVTSNEINGTTVGVILGGVNNAQVGGIVTDNTFNGVTDTAMVASGNGGTSNTDRGAQVELRAVNNTINGSGGVTVHGIRAEAYGYSNVKAFLLENKITGTQASGISGLATGGTATERGGSLELIATGNIVDGAGFLGNGVSLSAAEFGFVDADFADNTISGATNFGLIAIASGGTTAARGGRMELNLLNNTINGLDAGGVPITDAGISLTADNFANIEARIEQTTVTGADIHAVQLYTGGGTGTVRGGFIDLYFINNEINGLNAAGTSVTNGGLYMNAAGYSDIDAYVGFSEFSGVEFQSIVALSSGGSAIARGGRIDLLVADNELNGYDGTGTANGEYAVATIASEFSNIETTIARNNIRGFTTAALHAYASGGNAVTNGGNIIFNVTENGIDGRNSDDTVAGTNGIFLQGEQFGVIAANIFENDLTGFTQNGISSILQDYSRLSGAISNNEITNTGVAISLFGAGGTGTDRGSNTYLTIEGNQISGGFAGVMGTFAESADAFIDVKGNTISAFSGVAITSAGDIGFAGAGVTAFVSNNTITDAFFGMIFTNQNQGNLGVLVDGNSLSNFLGPVGIMGVESGSGNLNFAGTISNTIDDSASLQFLYQTSVGSTAGGSFIINDAAVDPTTPTPAP